ncbi:MAG TPA: DNA repair protein RecO [Thermoanaerobaculia bacterium]|nr:DNA repair protein RecO [Thermoanaerobaculia bacterium]
MGLATAEAFILGTHPLKERDRIVSFLTRHSGKRRGVAKRARGGRSHFSGMLEPMTEARVVFFEREGSELVSIDSVDSVRSSFSLSKDLERALLVCALAESFETFVSDSEPAEPFYRLARHSMDALFAGAPAKAVAAYFDVWILKLSGLFPSPSECAGCARPLGPEEPLVFDESRPGFIGEECRRGETLRLSGEAAATLRGILTRPLDPKGTPRGVAEIITVARRSRRSFLGHELKSQRVLAEVLGS